MTILEALQDGKLDLGFVMYVPERLKGDSKTVINITLYL